MKKNNTYHLLSSILKILKMMTEAGAEIYRVEESAKLIFASYGFENIDVTLSKVHRWNRFSRPSSLPVLNRRHRR